MNEQTELTDLANEARDAYLDWLDASIQGLERRAKRRRLNKALDAIAKSLDCDRAGAERYLLRNV